jgi:hypothetical protein
MLLLRLDELRVNRKRHRFPRRPFRFRKLSLMIPKVSETFLEVQGDRVIDASTNAMVGQVLYEIITTIRHSHNILMKNVPPVVSDARRQQLEPELLRS